MYLGLFNSFTAVRRHGILTNVTNIGKRNATAYCEAIIPENGKAASSAIGTYAIIIKK